jgi:hypothetical protein
MKINDIPVNTLDNFRRGVVIPALPLALDAERRLLPRYQRGLIRYYMDAGAGGIAVGVHTTQFEIREPGIDLYEPVLALASETIDKYGRKDIPPMKIAGVCGKTAQAVDEAELAHSLGYHACLLSLAALKNANQDEMIAHCRAVAECMPVIGFYLQTAVGGRVLPYDFWRQFAEIDNILAIKMAPFNRYQTLDVVRAVCDAGRENDITLYTGNDDNILVDLLTPFEISTPEGIKQIRIKGGLLGHWAVWTRKAAALLGAVHAIAENNTPVPPEILTLAAQITDANGVFFDAANNFAGCIPGIHEVLRRQGLMAGIWCLNRHEDLSPGQSRQIDRIYRSYPHLNDDDFVKENLERWLRE